jgi:hypothetical protein
VCGAFPLASHVRFGSSTLRSKYSCFDVEMCDSHDQTVVRVAELDGSGICLNIVGLNDHDPYQLSQWFRAHLRLAIH